MIDWTKKSPARSVSDPNGDLTPFVFFDSGRQRDQSLIRTVTPEKLESRACRQRDQSLIRTVTIMNKSEVDIGRQRDQSLIRTVTKTKADLSMLMSPARSVSDPNGDRANIYRAVA